MSFNRINQNLFITEDLHAFVSSRWIVMLNTDEDSQPHQNGVQVYVSQFFTFTVVTVALLSNLINLTIPKVSSVDQAQKYFPLILTICKLISRLLPLLFTCKSGLFRFTLHLICIARVIINTCISSGSYSHLG
jgi:hypothetical protein